jgi:release factor glutamine methyltransferase
VTDRSATTCSLLLAVAVDRLLAAGVESPAYDAGELLAFVLGVPRTRLAPAAEVTPDQAAAYDALVARRAAREPLQHLTGFAHFRHVELAVGPGVFVPRPETELLAGWAVEQATGLISGGVTRAPVVVDLGTGSGAMAKAIAYEVPHARVHAVELDELAHAWAARNLADTGVDLRLGDLLDAFDDLAGTVDVVVSNPPYIPHEAWESVAPEVRDHDPELALYATGDGLDAIRVVERRAALLLRNGGVVGVEHADVQGVTAQAVFTAADRWTHLRDHADLTGRARFVTARLAR